MLAAGYPVLLGATGFFLRGVKAEVARLFKR
jgi:hypothetical protein